MKPDPREVYLDLRQRVLTLKPQDIGLSGDIPLAGMMEFRLGKVPVTIVAVADGSVSLYLGSGGGMIGAGEHEAVRAAAGVFLGALAEAETLLEPATTFPLPGPGRVRFYLVHGGVRTAEVAETAAQNGRDAFAALYALGHDVLAGIRECAGD